MPGERSANLRSSALRAVGGSVMAAPYLIQDLHGQLDRDAVLRMNNASAQETSLLTLDRFNQLIDWASVALTIPSATACAGLSTIRQLPRRPLPLVPLSLRTPLPFHR